MSKELKLDRMISKERIAFCKLIDKCEDCPFCDYCNYLSKNNFYPCYANFKKWLNEKTNENEED